MKDIIVVTRQELEEIVDNCFARFLPKLIESLKQPEPKFLYSMKELGNFLGCSTVTAQQLKNSGRIRFKQFGRKHIFNTVEILEDLDKKQWRFRNRRTNSQGI
jgi:hypothetical protein